MKLSQRFFAIVSLLCLFASLLPTSAFADADDFSYIVADDQQGIIITAYNGNDTEVTVPETMDGLPVVEIAENAFGNNETMTSVALPDTLRIIAPRAFESCTALTAINVPDSVTKIGAQAFYNCSSLSSITLSPYTYDIGFEAFHNTKWLIRRAKGPVYIGRVLYTYFGAMSENTTLTIKDYTAAIAPCAFENRKELVAVNVPVGLRMIGDNAFADCIALQSIRISPTTTAIGDNVFDGSGLTVVKCADGSAIDVYCEKYDLLNEIDNTLDYLDGDMDKSGAVDSSDFRVLMRAIVLGNECDHERFLSSDIVYDGVVDTKDLREWMMQSIL